MLPSVGYWGIRGLGAPIKYLLHFAGQPFQDKQYIRKPPNYDCPEWVEDKANGLKLDFPNLPYYIDGDVRLTQVLKTNYRPFN